ncbi:MAG: hypothetical protein Q8K68_02770, partial [Nitrospirota bacterium]|nr:hypothetical protein [Nitrospirota bacterium]
MGIMTSSNQRGINKLREGISRFTLHVSRFSKLSLVLIFIVLFSAFMLGGALGPKEAEALLVGTDFSATNVASGTGGMTGITGTYGVGAGGNRLLVVVAQWEGNDAS